jgi:hypothetical protein
VKANGSTNQIASIDRHAVCKLKTARYRRQENGITNFKRKKLSFAKFLKQDSHAALSQQLSSRPCFPAPFAHSLTGGHGRKAGLGFLVSGLLLAASSSSPCQYLQVGLIRDPLLLLTGMNASPFILINEGALRAIGKLP